MSGMSANFKFQCHKMVAYAALLAKFSNIAKKRAIRNFRLSSSAARRSSSRYKIGWLFANHLDSPFRHFTELHETLEMRVSQIALWINAHSSELQCEIYQPEHHYDAVIFFKAMGQAEQQEAKKIRAYGGRIIFDANVNYYERWGEFGSFSNTPTEDQQKNAVKMTTEADYCVCDSTVLCQKASQFNTSTCVIPDNVNLHTFKYVRRHRPARPVRLVWSGISFKADHLLLLQDVLPHLENTELILVSEQPPQAMKTLKPLITCRFVPYSDCGYAWLLGKGDIIISPKQLVNSYEIGHSEYKITLGMAAGLPAVASPQQSYIEAISHKEGGVIARTTDEWITALTRLINDHVLRQTMGSRARQTVVEYYSTPVIAEKYLMVIKQCLTQ